MDIVHEQLIWTINRPPDFIRLYFTNASEGVMFFILDGEGLMIHAEGHQFLPQVLDLWCLAVFATNLLLGLEPYLPVCKLQPCSESSSERQTDSWRSYRHAQY